MNYKKILCMCIAAAFLLTAVSGATAQSKIIEKNGPNFYQKEISDTGTVKETKLKEKYILETDNEIKIMGLSFNKIYPINQEDVIKEDGLRVKFTARFSMFMSPRIILVCIFLQALPVYLTEIEPLDEPGDSIIKGRVIDEQEEPIAYAELILKPGPEVDSVKPVAETKTNEEGFYQLKVKSGDYVITASKEGYKSESKEIGLEPEETVEVNFTLESIETVVLTLDTMPQNLPLELFSLEPAPIAIQPTTDGKLHATYKQGTKVEITVQEEYGNYIFDHWSEDAEGEENPLEVVMDKDKLIIANFEQEPENQPPEACFEYSPEQPVAGQVLTLDASCSEDSDGEIVKYTWIIYNSGQELIMDGEIVEVTPPVPGSYNVKLTVVDDDGASDLTYKVIEVTESQEHKNGTIKGKVTDMETGEPIPEAYVKARRLLNMDPQEQEEIYETLTDEEGCYEIELRPGVYFVSAKKVGYKTSADTVYVKAEEIKIVDFSLKKEEENQPPVANFSYEPLEPSVGVALIFDGRSSYDPDGLIVLHKWLIEKDGYSHTFLGPVIYVIPPETGVYVVTLTVVDNNGAEGALTKEIEVNE